MANQQQTIGLLGIPLQDGTHEKGCLMGPDALRTAGLIQTLQSMGFQSRDYGNVRPQNADDAFRLSGNALNASEIAGWTRAIQAKAAQMLQDNCFPLFMGGDHALSIGTVAALAEHANGQDRPLYVLWLDAHPDFNSPGTSESGNMHGMSVAAFCGLPELSDLFEPKLNCPVDPTHVHMIGIRSVDAEERVQLKKHQVHVNDMRLIDEIGVMKPLQRLIDDVKANNGLLHVSLDVDFLDPSIAPAVGTTVPGGATFREAHLIMELLHESGLVTSLDIVELNPFLDERGKTAELLTDLAASLFGRKIFDRPTRHHRNTMDRHH
ncbi:arginase [Cohaesibacter gelatinilyticus]|uniref:Arginase n=1 Tax=Cohaesibacter gelatinilyticus TaxID=372072 RepID=A0A285PGC5_9HYPH|nr:arginase [Cohaesibacter gelatinilyticus]SNZ20744.1 arginase [Cohaesibacter gelatinilyticus]